MAVNNEPTKSCIVLLKIENKIWKIVRYPFELLAICMGFVLKFVNWCIVGSLFRIFGLPLTVYFGWRLISSSSGNSTQLSNIEFAYILLIALSLTGFIFSWSELPENQKKIVLER